MPITYTIDAARSLVVTKIDGHIDEAEMRAHVAAAALDRRLDACCLAIVDISQWVETSVGSNVVAELAMSGRAPHRRKVALIAPGDMGYGLARVFQGFRGGSGGTVEVFRQRADAEAWLGIARGAPA
jgi:hypothetical protein